MLVSLTKAFYSVCTAKNWSSLIENLQLSVVAFCLWPFSQYASVFLCLFPCCWKERILSDLANLAKANENKKGLCGTLASLGKSSLSIREKGRRRGALPFPF